MEAVFADTFSWIAFPILPSVYYRDALALDTKMAGISIVTTDDVLSEFLTFFAGDRWLRDRAIVAVKSLSRNRRVLSNDRHFEQEGFRTLFRISRKLALLWRSVSFLMTGERIFPAVCRHVNEQTIKTCRIRHISQNRQAHN